MKLRKETNFDPSLYDKDIGSRLFGNTEKANKYTKQIQEISLPNVDLFHHLVKSRIDFFKVG